MLAGVKPALANLAICLFGQLWVLVGWLVGLVVVLSALICSAIGIESFSECPVEITFFPGMNLGP